MSNFITEHWILTFFLFCLVLFIIDNAIGNICRVLISRSESKDSQREDLETPTQKGK